MTVLFRFAGICLFVFAPLLSMSGCAASSASLRDYEITSNLQGLTRDVGAEPTILYKRQGVPGLEAYDSFIVDPVRVSYSDPEMSEVPVEQLTRIQLYFQDAMIKELRSAGYTVGTRSEKNRMRITLSITGLKAPNPIGNVSNVVLQLPVSLSVGEVTVEAQFRNSEADRLDAVVVTRTQGSRLFKEKPWSTWADVESGIDQWATGFRQAVEAARGNDEGA